MYHKVRITVASLVVIAITVLSSTGTLSYFTDTDAKVNDFTVGSVSTALAIYDDVTGGNKHELVASNYVLTSGEARNIPFYLQAENDGTVSVYQRFRVVIPIALASVVTLETPNNANYVVTYNSSVNNTYAEYYIVNQNVLGVGQVTNEWPTVAIHINGNFVANDPRFVCEGDGNNCVLGIRAYSDAIQAAGFTDATTAFGNLTETY